MKKTRSHTKSLRQQIAEAQSPDEIDALLHRGMRFERASHKTQRSWVAAAQFRRKELAQQSTPQP